MKRPIFVAGGLYHIYNRGVDKRVIFLDESDYLRAVHDLWEFNDENPAPHLFQKYVGSPTSVKFGNRLVKIPKTIRGPRKLLVKIHAFVFMKNHFHMLIEPIKDTGVTEFMRKFGTGYTNYFNEKYERSGSLFQGLFKAVQIDQESHFVHIPYYIHCNPLDYKFNSWRERKISTPQEAFKFLENYRWSSFPDYIGKKNFPSVTKRDFLNQFLGGQGWREAMKGWLDKMYVDTIDKRYFLE